MNISQLVEVLAVYNNNAQFWSKDAGVCAQAEQWMDWSQTALQPDFLNGIFLGFYRTPESQCDMLAIQKSIERCKKHFLLLDSILKKQPFLGGDNISLADIPAGAILYRYFELEIERPVIPNVEAWYQRLQARPAYREHVMVSFSDMKGRL